MQVSLGNRRTFAIGNDRMNPALEKWVVQELVHHRSGGRGYDDKFHHSFVYSCAVKRCGKAEFGRLLAKSSGFATFKNQARPQSLPDETRNESALFLSLPGLLPTDPCR